MSFLNQRLLIFLLPLLMAAAARAADVRAYVQPNPARPNQVVNFVIAVQDGAVNSIPALRFPLQVMQTSGAVTSQQINIVNGRQSRSTNFSWGIMASEPGEFVIPPQDVVVDGQIVKTPEVKFTVVQSDDTFSKAGADGGLEPILQLELGKKEVYVGEVVPLACTLYVPREAPLRRLGLIDIEKNDFAIARFPQQSEQTSTVIDGVGYQVLTFRSTLSALRPGDLQVGPAKMEILVEVPMAEQPRQPPGFPQFFFGPATEPRKVIAQTPTVRLNVLPLPTEGKPANFTGAVGDFTMEVTASPTELTVGDPISVEIIVAGGGNFDALQTPALASTSGWRLYPAKRYSIEGNLDQNMPSTVERKVGYTQVLVPEAVHKELPPFEMSFFSPTQKKYVTLRSEAIALVMQPAAATAAPVAEATGASTAAGTPPPPPATKPQAALSDIVVKPPVKAHWVAPIGSLLWQDARFWALQAVPVALLILALIYSSIRRRREAKRQGRAGEVRAAWTALESGDPDDVEFLRRAAQLIHKTQNGHPVTDPGLRAILDRYESASFSVGSNGVKLTGADRKGVIQKLEPLVRSSLAVVLLLASATFVSAQESKAPAGPDQVYQQAVQEIEKGNFTKAQYLAESLTKKNPPQLSAEVFQLIGHARYRQDDMGRAALWYQRAELLDARSPELRQNLRHLDEKLGFLTFATASPFVKWSYWFSPNEWVIIAAVGVWLIFLALAWRVLAGRRVTGWAVTLVVLGFLIAAPSAGFAAVRVPGPERVRDIAVVVLPDVQAFTAATVTSGSVIELPPGSQVRILERRGAWAYVEIPSGAESLRGWVEVPAMAPLWPWEPELLP